MQYAIGVSDFSIDILRPYLNPNIQLTKIYSPIDFQIEEQVDFTKNEYFLYVGRLNKEKGVNLFCQAVTELGKKGIVVGDGDEKQRLEQQYPTIEFTGWKSKREVEEYMKKAKCLIFPSLWYETAGLTILEAQVLGIPSLVSNRCAGKEFVEEWFTFDNQNIEELKEKMLQIEKYDKKITVLYDYSKSNYIKQLLQFFENIMLETN